MYLDSDGDGEADAYYYATSAGLIVTNKKYWISKTNDLLPEGKYTFDETGKITDAPSQEDKNKNGIYADETGTLYYYENGVKAFGGLMYLDSDGDGEADAYYYATSAGLIITNKKYWISKTNDLLPEGKYTFDETGKITDAPSQEDTNKNGIYQDESGKLYYYENGVKAFGGLMYLDSDGDGEADAYYYATSAGEIITNRKYWITKTNDLLPEGKYTFDESGKIVF